MKKPQQPQIIALFIFICFLLEITSGFSQSLMTEKQWLQPNGKVYSILNDQPNNMVYIGGDFNHVGIPSPYGIAINKVSAEPDLHYAAPNGTVTVSVSDGEGGWYIGGDFTKVGNHFRTRIAHINSLGEVTNKFEGMGFENSVKALLLDNDIIYAAGSFEKYGDFRAYGVLLPNKSNLPDYSFPEFNGKVTASVKDEFGGLYVAGDFSMVGDSIRNGLAYIDVNGVVTDFNVQKTGIIHAFCIHDGLLFVGGVISMLGGVEVGGIGAIDLSTASVTSFTPDFMTAHYSIGIIHTISAKDNYVYVGGFFEKVNNTNTYQLAKIDIASGALQAFPMTGYRLHSVNASIIDGNTLYIGGSFSSLGGESRANLAAIDLISNTVTTWNPGADNNVKSLVINNGKLYAGGDFANISGVARNRIAELDLSTGVATSWNPGADNQISFMNTEGNSLFVAGNFGLIGGSNRKYVAEFDITTGSLTSWNPDPDAHISTLLINGDDVFIGGSFLYMGAEKTSHLAAIDTNNNLLLPTTPAFNDEILSIELYNDVIIVGGRYTEVNALSKSYLSAFDKNTGNVTAWSPAISHSVTALKVFNDKLIVSGYFNQINGLNREAIAGFDLDTWALNSFSPSISGGYVLSIDVAGGLAYLGGSFTHIDGIYRRGAAAVDAASGSLQAWDPSVSTTVNCIKVIENVVYVGGNFNSVNGQSQYHIASIDAVTGMLNTWDAFADRQVRTISSFEDKLYVGGDFSSVYGKQRYNAAAFNRTTGELTDWKPDPVGGTSTVRDILMHSGQIYLAGSFTHVGGQSRGFLASVDPVTGAVSSWNPNLSGVLVQSGAYAIDISGNNIIAGGEFRYVDGNNIAFLCAIDATTGLPTSWNPALSSPVNILQVNSGNVFIGGSFTSIEGQNRDRVGEVDLTTGQPTAWNPGADMYVRSLFHDNNTVYVGGDFTQVGGQDRQHIAAIDASTGIVKSWNPGASGRVTSFNVVNDDLYVGGGFSSIGGYARSGLAVLDKNTGDVSSWDPKIGGSYIDVYAIDLYDDRILVGGQFSFVDSERRQNLAVYSLFYSVQYFAGENGSLSGETEQFVKPGQNGSEIIAIPGAGYHFVKWSDDVTNNPRTDLNVNTDIEVTAIFERTPPIADFEADITYTEVPGVISFTDQSLNIPESWEWNFGDGNTSTEQNPTHEYTVQGIYPVSLTVTNSAGSDNLVKSDYIVAEQCSNGLITQTDWSGGPGQADIINDSTMFDSSANIDFSSVQGQISGSFSSSESDMATFFYNGKLYNARSYGLMTMDTVTNQWNYEVKITGLNNAAKVTIMNDTLYVLTGWNIYYTDGSSDDFGMGNNGWRLHSVFPSTNLHGAYSLGSFQGQLYVGVRNTSSQGHVYRYNGANWIKIGGQVSVVPTTFYVYNNELYVGSHWSAAIYKKTTTDNWSYQYAPSSMMYVSDFVEFQGSLYAAIFKNTYYNGVIVRFNGSTWSTVFSGSGCYSLAVADNVMYVSTQNSTGGAGQILQTTNGTSYTTAYVLTPDEARAVLASDGKKLYHGTVKKSGTFSSNFYIDKQISFNYLNASLKSSHFTVHSPAYLTAEYAATVSEGTGFAVLLQGKEEGSDWNINRFYKPLLNNSSMMFHDDLYRYEVVLWTTEPALSPVINDITLTQTGEVLTTNVTSIDYHSAESGGSVDIYCTHAINSKGIVWSTSQEPTVENNMGMTNEGSNFDEFTSFLSGLNHNTDYYVRAYASTDYVTIYGQQHSFKTLTHAPVVDFEADIISGPAPLDVCFTDLSIYDPETWEWDFGDSSVSSLQNPCHTYVGIGTYNVFLIVENTGGSDTLIKTNYINVVKPDVINGDVNNDLQVNILDVVWFVDYLNGFVHEDYNIYAADVNDDLTIDVSDFTLLLDIIYGGN